MGVVMPPKANGGFGARAPADDSPAAPPFALWLANETGLRPRYFGEMDSENDLAAPRNSWPKGGELYKNRKAA